MRGARGAKEMMAAYLEMSLPPYMDLMRARWSLEFEDIPEPAVYLARDPGRELDTWPTVSVVVMRAPRFRRIEEQSGADTLYEVTYLMRVFGWVRALGYERTIDIRDDFMQTLLVLLLDYQTIDEDQTSVVDENTLAIDYSDTPALKGDRFLSSAFVSFEFKVEEKLQRTDRVHGSVGVENEVIIDVHGTGPTQLVLA